MITHIDIEYLYTFYNDPQYGISEIFRVFIWGADKHGYDTVRICEATPGLLQAIAKRVQSGKLQIIGDLASWYGTFATDVYKITCTIANPNVSQCKCCSALMSQPGYCAACEPYVNELAFARLLDLDDLPDDQAEYYRGILE